MKAVVLAGSAAIQIALAGHAFGATCADSNALDHRLQTKFGERLAYTGQARENHTVLVYTSQKTGRWTMLVETPEGLACLIASGKGKSSLGDRIGHTVDVAFR